MWLSREFLDWYAFIEVHQNNADTDWAGANQIWIHAGG